DPALLALAEPLACCINGQELARVSQGDTVLIIGGGPIGCLHALLARLRGAEKVIVSELLENRIVAAKRAQADRVVDAASESLNDVVSEETGGQGVDVILPATPEVKVDDSIMRMLASRGRLCIFSGPKAENGREMIDVRSLHYRETTLVGAYGSTSSLNREAVRMIASGELDLGWVITKRSPLDKIGDAMEHSARRLCLKAVIDF
ncbi:MAG TPA: zinc-binding dehydrogenase, partial [Methanotrichaceae archaeon]|nr:zinc-binding dehydrogenase [Methanotrichaceae archaeon]